MSEPTKRRGLSRPLAECMESTLRPTLKKHGLAESRILTDWQHIAGEYYARRCVPERLAFPQGESTGGTLHLRVANGFALEIQHQTPLLLEKIATYFGHAAVKRITIMQAPMITPKSKRLAPPRALDEKTRQQLKEMVEGVSHNELKQSLASLGKTVLGK